jgi:carbamoyl-phosphate synthase large subunit
MGNQMNNMLNVLITGAGSTMGQSIYKALIKSKYTDVLNVIFTNSEIDGAGFFMSNVKKCYVIPEAKDGNYINKIIDVCKNEKINIIFSGTEHEIIQLAKNKNRIKNETGAIVLLSNLDVIEIGTDKYKTAKYFEEHGIPFPKTVLFDDYLELVKEVGFPIFMKPRISSSSRNIYKIENEKQLFKYKFAMSDEIILQEYLDSDIEYTVETFVDSNGNICGSIPIKRELKYGLSISGEIDRNEEAIKVSENIAMQLRPIGPINVQLKMIDGKPVPFEINTRFSSTECIRANYGFNAVEASIKHFLFDETVKLSYREGMFIRYWNECYFEKEDYEELKKMQYLKIVK